MFNSLKVLEAEAGMVLESPLYTCDETELSLNIQERLYFSSFRQKSKKYCIKTRKPNEIKYHQKASQKPLKTQRTSHWLALTAALPHKTRESEKSKN